MKEVRFAIIKTIPIFFTYIFLGIAFGILMAKAGYSLLWSVASAVFIYAGSIQIAMVSLLTAGTPLPLLAMITFFVNARHAFYGIGLIDRFRKMGWRYPYMVVSLTDQTYSVFCSISDWEGLNENRAAFLIALFDHIYWITGCFLGSCAGQYLKLDTRGIEFSATAFFLVVVVNQWRQSASKRPILYGLFSALSCYLLFGSEYFVIPALMAVTVLLIVFRNRIPIGEG